ncbi:hypothetical protein [Actinomadura sp. NPDC049753]|uniref:hypothetical protein n=1 Tax=Actinomadura sp. NPDC049753 TaxID=3154739 RepID=UPI00341BBB38
MAPTDHKAKTEAIFGTTHASEQEYAEADANGINLGIYWCLRDMDVPHEEVLDAHVKNIPLVTYAVARETLSHAEALDAFKQDPSMKAFTRYRH